MNKRYGSILIVSVTIFVLCFVGTVSATNWTVNGSGGADFTGIQDAINNAKDGDSIMVHSGVYYENVVVNKSVTLKGIDHPVVDAGGEGNAITLSADGITLVGFNATNSGSWWTGVGIEVTSNKNTITGNNVSNNNWYGISLYDSNNNTIYFNNFINNTDIVFSYESTNIRNSTEKITYIYNGTTYESYLGNYWSDYEGTNQDAKEIDPTGIWDTSYSIKYGDKDNYPLMNPFENYV